MKKFISMFAFAAVLVLGAFAFASCGSDDDDKDNPSAIITFKIEASATLAEPGSMMSELNNIAKSVALSTFTAPKNATAEELNAKVEQIVKAADMEAKVKEKALAAGIKSYDISFRVVGDGNQRIQPVSYSIRYIPAVDGDDVVQLYTMLAANFQTDTQIPKDAYNDLVTIRDNYKSKFSFTYTGKKAEAFEAMKKYLESDEVKEFRDVLQKHIDTYNDAKHWYVGFRMRGENNLFTDMYCFGEMR